MRLGLRSRVAAAGTVAVIASAFLPWARTGRVVRSGFGLVRAAQAAGLVRGWPLRLLVAGVFLIPVLAVATWVASALSAALLAALFAGTAGAVGMSAAAIVLASPASTEFGAFASLAAGGVTLLAALLVLGRRNSDG